MNELSSDSPDQSQVLPVAVSQTRMPTGKTTRASCIFFAVLHVLVTAISTYMATFEIRSIVFSGGICAMSGIALGVTALFCKRSLGRSRFWLALVGLATLALAFGLVAAVRAFSLSPREAALPFGVVLLIHQAICVPVILRSINRLIYLPQTGARFRFSIKSLFVLMFVSAIFFALARFLLEYGHTWLMSVGLAFLGLATMGLTVTVFIALSRRANDILASGNG